MGSTLLNLNILFNLILTLVLVPIISSEIILENSVPIFIGSTLLIVPFVKLLSFPKFFILHYASLFIVSTEIDIPYDYAYYPTLG